MHYKQLERFARMFGSTPPKWDQISSSFSDSTVTGAFRHLPPELVDYIVTVMLASSPHVPPTSNEASIAAMGVFHFLRTCRGAAAAVSRDNRIEVIARAALESITPIPGAAPHRAFTELAMCSVRSMMEAHVLFRVILSQVTHCATTTGNCCRSGRVKLNERLARRLDHGTDPLVQALTDASIGEGRTKVQVSVATAQQASLLCATERGAAISLGQGPSRKVVCVTSQPAEVYSPEHELAREFVCEYTDTLHQVVHACSEGHLIALLLKNYHQEDTEPQVDVWDMRQNVLVDTRRVATHTRHIWMHNGTLYGFDWLVLDDFRSEGGSTEISYYRPMSPPGSADHSGGAIPLHGVCAVMSVSVARGTGDLVFIDARWSEMEERLVFVDVKRSEHCCFDPHRVCSPAPDATSVVALSPTGRVMVMLGRSHSDPGVWVYRRHHRSDEDPLAGLNWCIFARSPCDSPGNNFPRPLWYATKFGIFSPCGSMVWFFFRNAVSGEHFAIDVHAVIKTGGIDSRPARHLWIPEVVPGGAVWGNDGLFLKTGTGWGILRVGTQ